MTPFVAGSARSCASATGFRFVSSRTKSGALLPTAGAFEEAGSHFAPMNMSKQKSSDDGRDPRPDPSACGAAKSDHQQRDGDGEENQIHPRHIARDWETGEEDKVADQRHRAESEAGPELPVETAVHVWRMICRA
jgi:hypothetical protein